MLAAVHQHPRASAPKHGFAIAERRGETSALDPNPRRRPEPELPALL
jgi:hypothetical protein